MLHPCAPWPWRQSAPSGQSSLPVAGGEAGASVGPLSTLRVFLIVNVLWEHLR